MTTEPTVKVAKYIQTLKQGNEELEKTLEQGRPILEQAFDDLEAILSEASLPAPNSPPRIK